MAEYLWYELSRGIESYMMKLVALSRRRVIPASYGNRIVVDAVPKFYSTAALVNNPYFAVPAVIAAQLPADPPETPDWSAWGWRLRQQVSDFTLASNKLEETMDWVFDAWSIMSNQYVHD